MKRERERKEKKREGCKWPGGLAMGDGEGLAALDVQVAVKEWKRVSGERESNKRVRENDIRDRERLRVKEKKRGKVVGGSR